MSKKMFFGLLISILLISALSGCAVDYKQGVPGCAWGLFNLGGFAPQGAEHPKQPGFFCQSDGSFKRATPGNETSPTPGSEAAAPTSFNLACDTIQSSTDGSTWIDSGENLKTESVYDIGDRVTWTDRKIVVPSVAWNEPLTQEQLAKVEKTWVRVRYNACDTTPVVFAGGVRINELEFNDGALFQLKSGNHELEIRNGELILWYDQPHLEKDITGRLVKEVRNGNFDVTSRLGLAVTDSLKSFLPDDILTGVMIVLLP